MICVTHRHLDMLLLASYVNFNHRYTIIHVFLWDIVCHAKLRVKTECVKLLHSVNCYVFLIFSLITDIYQYAGSINASFIIFNEVLKILKRSFQICLFCVHGDAYIRVLQFHYMVIHMKCVFCEFLYFTNEFSAFVDLQVPLC